jgi:hypothetical protein
VGRPGNETTDICSGRKPIYGQINLLNILDQFSTVTIFHSNYVPPGSVAFADTHIAVNEVDLRISIHVRVALVVEPLVI